MSTVKRPSSASPSPSPQSKKRQGDDLGTGEGFSTDGDADTAGNVRPVEDSGKTGDAEAAGVEHGANESNNVASASSNDKPGDKPDVEYRGLLFFSGEAWEHHDNEDYGVDDGYFELYFKKPSFWDSDDYYTIVWEVGENGIEETFDEEALESPMTTPPTSPIFNTATMFTLEQIQSLYIANPSPTSSEAESVTVKTASSRSPARSASLPPSPAIAYMRLSWPSSREWQALLTCEVFAPRGEPTNFRVRRLSHNFNGNHEASEVYFQNPERDDEIIWDDNANPLIIGHICWNSDPLDFVKIYGKRVIKDFFSTELSDAEKQMIVASKAHLRAEWLQEWGIGE